MCMYVCIYIYEDMQDWCVLQYIGYIICTHAVETLMIPAHPFLFFLRTFFFSDPLCKDDLVLDLELTNSANNFFILPYTLLNVLSRSPSSGTAD